MKFNCLIGDKLMDHNNIMCRVYLMLLKYYSLVVVKNKLELRHLDGDSLSHFIYVLPYDIFILKYNTLIRGYLNNGFDM